MKKIPLSLVIITLNEEKNLLKLLPLFEKCQEIIVVDSFSQDKTLEVTQKFGGKIFQRAFDNHVNQKNFALQQASCPWILSLDGDERLTPSGVKKIFRLIQKIPPDYDGYSFPRLTRYLGRWIRGSGWYPNRQLRLFQRGKGHFEGENPHDRVHLSGNCKSLNIPILHFSFPNFSSHLKTVGDYAQIACREMVEKKRFFYFSLVSIRPFLTFLRDYFLRRGYHDGLAGFIISIFKSFSVFLKYSYLFEYETKKTGSGDPL